MTERTVAASLARALVDFAAGRGGDPATIVAQAGITMVAMADRDARVAFDSYVSLTRAAIAATGDPALPLHFGAEIDLSEVSIVGLIGLASETMAEALVQLNRYGKLVIEVDVGGDRFANEMCDGGVWAVDRRANPNDFPELTETTFARMLCGARRIAPELRALEVHVTHPAPAHAAVYEEVLGAPVTFSSHWNAYRVDPSFVTHRVQKQPRYVFGILTNHAEVLLRDMEAAATMRGQVEALVLPLLHTGDISVDRIATTLGMSRATLYRRLKDEAVTFETVVDDLRHRMAVQYLDNGAASINEVAYLVGFSEPSAFSRAFKRWTGEAPGARRKRFP